MAQTPRFSIIILSKDYAHYIERALKSLEAQEEFDLGSLEVIVVDDGSTDETIAVLDRAVLDKSSLNVRYFRNESNLGPAKSLEIGLKAAEGEIISQLDADDFFLASTLSLVSNAFSKNSTVDVVVGNYFLARQWNQKAFLHAMSGDTGVLDPENFRSFLIREIDLPPACFWWRRSLIKSPKAPNSEILINYDLEHRWRLFQESTAYVLDQAFCVKNQHRASLRFMLCKHHQLYKETRQFIEVMQTNDLGEDAYRNLMLAAFGQYMSWELLLYTPKRSFMLLLGFLKVCFLLSKENPRLIPPFLRSCVESFGEGSGGKEAEYIPSLTPKIL